MIIIISRKIEKRYSISDYRNVISIVNNIIIGLKSIKFYQYIQEETLSEIEKQIEILEEYEKSLISLTIGVAENEKVEIDLPHLKQLTFIFKIEEYYKPLVSSIWSKELTNINNFNEQNYKILVHMCRNNDSLEYILNVINNPNIHCVSTSLISDNKHDVFSSHNADFGFIYKVDENNFLGACENDAQMYTTKSNSKKNQRNRYYTLKRFEKYSINACKDTYLRNYQMVKTKTPFCLQNPYNIENIGCFYNEVGIVNDKSKINGILQFYYGNKFLVYTNDQSTFLSNEFNLPIVYINRSPIRSYEDFLKHRYIIIECVNKILEGYGFRNYLSYESDLEKTYNFYLDFSKIESRRDIKSLVISR